MKYTKDILATAARNATSVGGVLRNLNIAPTGGMHAHISRRLKHFGIDTSHFRWRPLVERMAPVTDRDGLVALVGRCESLAEVLRGLGLPPSGSNYRGIRLLMDQYGIDASHFLGSAHQRGKRARNRLDAERALVVRPPGSARVGPGQLRRALGECGVPYTCAKCGLPAEWQGRPIVLHVDHINGDPLDCRRENLRFLCPNCHTQTWNYAGKGKRVRGGCDSPPGKVTSREDPQGGP